MGRFRGLPILIAVCGLTTSLLAATNVSGPDGLTVAVDPSGLYSISLPRNGWEFRGEVGAAVSNLNVAWNSDAAGPFSEISFDSSTHGTIHGAIRAYQNRKAVLFTVTYLRGSANTFSFPSLNRYPGGMNHITYSGPFAGPSFSALTADGPWVFFDQQFHTFILSPASHFMVSGTRMTSDGRMASGIDFRIASLPAGFTQQTLLVMEDGINNTFDAWGNLLTSLAGKVRPPNDADVTLNQFGYWTDNGATYYYRSEPSMTYAASLAAVKSDFDQHGLGLGYIQLDSWFYPKGPNADWSDYGDGIYQYAAAPALFGSNLSSYQQSLGLPLVAHARWIDTTSPYRRQYQMSNNVSIDPKYWAEAAGYLSASGITAYEQDWLANAATTNFNLNDPDAFLDNMAAAMAQRNITMQYCTPTPLHLMQGSKYSNLTTARVSQDRFYDIRWTDFLYTSRFASALGIWPFTDVFFSGERDNLLVATLSAGPVGIGDPIGSLNVPNLLRAVRKDGVIVKPDVPLTPLDRNFLNDSQSPVMPVVASTYSDFGGVRETYVFAYPRGDIRQITWQLSDFGVSQASYVYDYFADTGSVVNPGDTVNQTISGAALYLVIAPIGPSGIAVLGDTAQFVPMGKKRISNFRDDGTAHLTVAFAPGEGPRTIRGYAASAPVATGTRSRVRYDQATGLFEIRILHGANHQASFSLDGTGDLPADAYQHIPK